MIIVNLEKQTQQQQILDRGVHYLPCLTTGPSLNLLLYSCYNVIGIGSGARYGKGNAINWGRVFQEARWANETMQLRTQPNVDFVQQMASRKGTNYTCTSNSTAVQHLLTAVSI
jgi:hypothetical protein